jgi:uncharacterized membrane protein
MEATAITMAIIAILFGLWLKKELRRKPLIFNNLFVISLFGFMAEFLAVSILQKKINTNDVYEAWAHNDNMGALWIISFIIYVATAIVAEKYSKKSINKSKNQ